MLSPGEVQERVAGVHSGQFSAALLRGSSAFLAVPYVSLPLPNPTRRLLTHRVTPGAASSPGIGNFVTFPDQASPRAGECCKGPSRKCGPGLRRKRPAHPGPGTPGGGTPPTHRAAPAAGPPRRPSPRLTAASAPPAGGWSLPFAPRHSLQTLPSAGHGRRRRRSPGRIPRAGG